MDFNLIIYGIERSLKLTLNINKKNINVKRNWRNGSSYTQNMSYFVICNLPLNKRKYNKGKCKKKTQLLSISLSALLIHTIGSGTLNSLSASHVTSELFKNLNRLELFNPAFIEWIEYMNVTCCVYVRARQCECVWVWVFGMTFSRDYLTSENNQCMEM